MERTIRVAQFMYYVPTGEKRVVGDEEQDVLAVRHAFFGDTVDIPRTEDIETGDKAGAFDVPEQEEAASPFTDQEDDIFRSHDSLVSWIKNEKPAAAKVVGASDGDPAKAEALLRAEEEATGGQPRRQVQLGLAEILADEEEEE